MTDRNSTKKEIAMTADACPLDDEQLEHSMLMEIIELHPIHLTCDELHLALSYSREGLKEFAIKDSLWSLRRFGLIRENGKVLEPTLAALRAAEVIQRA
jgi:hypothetical protein